MKVSKCRRVVLCPHCEKPHAFVQIRHDGGVNDSGAWRIICEGCGRPFLLSVINPNDSIAKFQIETAFDEGETTPEIAWATSQVVHNLARTSYAPSFDLAGAPLYICPKSAENLERLALDALEQDINRVSSAYRRAEDFLVSKSAFQGHFAVAHLPLKTDCGCAHVATFYTDFKVNFKSLVVGDLLLADVSGACLQERLDGVFSKSDIMDLLSKLLIRWRLTSERVIVASPFVGHQWDDEDKKTDRWEQLLAQLDPECVTLITRPATFTAFKKLAAGDVTYDLLSRFGLENKLISANVKKHDFHAKFFIGFGPQNCEVLSGSANLVRGPSLENISFRKMPRQRCEEHYLAPMKLVLPSVRARSSQFVRLFKDKDNEWQSSEADQPF